MKSSKLLIPILITLALLASGCNTKPTASEEVNKDIDVYRPPTVIHQTPLVMLVSSPTISDSISTPRSTFIPSCSDELKFIDDVTIPDGTQVVPGETIDKRWLVENAGTCNWNESYRLRIAASAFFEAPVEQALYPARGGTQAVLRTIFAAPNEPGTYRTAWQAYNTQNQPFGDSIFIEIIVISNP